VRRPTTGRTARRPAPARPGGPAGPGARGGRAEGADGGHGTGGADGHDGTAEGHGCDGEASAGRSAVGFGRTHGGHLGRRIGRCQGSWRPASHPADPAGGRSIGFGRVVRLTAEAAHGCGSAPESHRLPLPKRSAAAADDPERPYRCRSRPAEAGALSAESGPGAAPLSAESGASAALGRSAPPLLARSSNPQRGKIGASPTLSRNREPPPRRSRIACCGGSASVIRRGQRGPEPGTPVPGRRSGTRENS